MSAIHQHRVSRRQPCPICQKTHGCLLYPTHVVCLRIGSDQPVSTGLGGWRHDLHPEQADQHLFQAALNIFTQPTSRLAPPEVLDRVYRSLLSHLTLSEAHRRHLTQERQMSPEVIAHRGYLSWGQGDRLLRSRLAETLYELHGGAILDVPGILLREQNSRSYLTLAGPSGLLIPVRNVEGQIVAFQIRADQPQKSGKYLWLSSSSRGGPGPGSPVHVSRPLCFSITAPPGRVWLTEGPLKADIASQILGELVLALPGAQADRHFLSTLEQLHQRGEVRELVLALDSDWHEKPQIAVARLKLAEAAARHGIPVTLADWHPKFKGLDDLLLAGGRPALSPYQVSGNGPRPLEEVAATPRQAPRPVSIKRARKLIKQDLNRAFDGHYGPLGEVGVLLNSLPGSGKSHLLTEVLNSQHRSRGMRRASAYFVPRHDLAQADEKRETWASMRGRTSYDPAHKQTPCAFPERQQELARLNIPGQLGCDHCPLKKACEEHLQPGQGQPYYLGQFNRKAKVRTYPAQHFFTPSLWGSPLSVILDDCDLRSLMLSELPLKLSALGYALHWAETHLEHAYSKAQPLLFLFYELLRQAPAGQVFTWHGAELIEQLQELARSHKLTLDQILADANQAEEPHPLAQNTLDQGLTPVPVRFLVPLRNVLEHEYQHYRQGQPYNRRLQLQRATPGQEARILLTLRRDLPLQALSNSLLILADASLTLEEARTLFPNRRWVQIKPTLHMPERVNIVQNISANYGKVHLTRPGEKERALEHIAHIVERHPGETIGLITHKSFTSDVRQRFPQLKVGHYFGQRGSNEFIDCTVLIAFGTPNPNPNDLERQAEALYWDDPKPLWAQTMLLPKTFRQKDGTPLQTRVRSYADPRLQQLLRSKRDEEMLQALFRARPLSLDPYNDLQLHLNFDQQQLRLDKRPYLNLYLFSSTPFEDFEVYIQQPEPKTHPASAAQPGAAAGGDNLVDFQAASARIWRLRCRLTDQRLAQAAQAQQAAVRRWKHQRPHQHLPAAPPPSHGPPLELSDEDHQLLASMF